MKLLDEAKTTKSIVSRVATLDSQVASELLDHMAKNRSVRRSRVARYRADMENDRWALNGEPIIISRDGQMIEGQHRCLAVQGTDAKVRTVFVLGVEPGAIATMGQGVPRTAGDYLGIEDEPHPRTAASIARYLIAYHANDGEGLKDTARATNVEVLTFYHEHREDIQRSAKLATENADNIRPFLAPAVFGFVHALLHTIDAEAADEYMTQVAKGELLTETDPAFVVRARMLHMGKSGAAKKASVILTGWNAYRQKRPLKQIRVSTRLPALA